MINQQWSEGRCWSVTGQLLERPGPEQNGSECPSKQLLYPRCDAIVDRDILLTQIGLLWGMVTFNVLRTIGQEVVALAEYAPKKITVTRWRLKTVLQEVIYSACRIVSHAGRFFLNFGSHCPWFDMYSRLPQALD